MFHLLPLLKGWEYKEHVAESKAVIRGAPPLKFLVVEERGWLFGITLLTNDVYGTVIIEYQGADLETKSFSAYPEVARGIGAFAQDPSGWAQRYSRPNPYSTAGVYFISVITSGFQGSLWPYVPSFKVSLYLPEESTQESAYIQALGEVVAITDAKAFIHSLRRVLDPKASLKIDPALLRLGPGQFKELKL